MFSRIGRVEAEWRTLTVAGMAAARASDAEAARGYFRRASQAYSKHVNDWGTEAAAGYAKRPDVQRLRQALAGD
jgi:hypothetical protein